ncbi:MAG: hypothetical protein AAF597_10970 [Bacteroidota bacterium]
MRNPERYYQESGAINGIGVITLLGIGLVAAAVLGAVYGYATYYIPLIYLNFFICLFFGIGVGKAVGKASIWGKVRNSKAMMGISLIIGLAAWYFAWVFWLNAFSEHESFMWNPAEIYSMTSLFAMLGIYEIFGWTPTGVALYVIWAIEAVIIIGGTFLSALGAMGRQPFCEESGDWTQESIVSSRLEPVVNPQDMITRLESHDMGPVTDLKLVDHNDRVRTKVTLYASKDSSMGSKYLTVDQVVVSYDDEGKAEENETAIVENLILNSGDYATLQEWRKTLSATTPAG